MTVKVMTMNIWGYFGNWVQRRKLLAKLIEQESPDIIGLQEVCDQPSFNAEGDHQAKQLAHLTSYPFVHYAPAYRRPDKALGQAVMSLHPIVAVEHLHFHRDLNDPKDTEDRIALWTRISYKNPSTKPDDLLEFCVTHLSLSQTARERSVCILSEWLTGITEHPKILVGDLNDEPNSLTVQFLLNKTDHPFADAWLVGRCKEDGFTFPSDAPNHRIDYILFSPKDAFRVEEVYLVGNLPDVDGNYPSDHLGVVAKLCR